MKLQDDHTKLLHIVWHLEQYKKSEPFKEIN